MGRFSEKQMLVTTIVVSALLVVTFVGLIWLDLQQIHNAEISEEHPEAAEIPEEEWGENRWIFEIKKQMKTAQEEADQISKREQDVIVYREIMQRDAQILPDVDDVNRLATTINDFEIQSGVSLKQVTDLSISPDAGGQAIRTMPIKLSLHGTFDQYLKFVNLFETLDRMINVRGFSVSAGRAMGEGRERQAIHDIQLELVTYIYSSSAGLSKPVDIANYDRRKDDPVIQRLVRQQKAAHVEKYQLKPRINRRDPLVDPRRRGGGGSEGPENAEDIAKWKAAVDRLRFEIELLKTDVAQEEIYAQERKYVPLTELSRIINEKVGRLDLDIVHVEPSITNTELREVLHDEVMTPFEEIKSKRKLINVPVIVSRQQVSEFLERMRGHLEAREYEKVVSTFTNYETLVKGREVAEDATELVAEMQEMKHQAEVMLEFLGLGIRVTGLILRTEGSMVILNGKMRKVGDFVDPANRCRLREIHQERLMFELDGFEIAHSLERNK